MRQPCFAARDRRDTCEAPEDNPPMAPPAKLTQLLSVSVLSLTACTSGSDAPQAAVDRDQAVHELQRISGAPVALEVGATGDARVLAMMPRFPVPGHAADPA